MADRVDELREKWERAIARDRPADAIAPLLELEKLAQREARWSQRLGEAYRRLGKMREAEEAFVRAMDRYIEQGFVPQAVAMSKLVIGMNPSRVDVLARIAPKTAPAPRLVPPPPATQAPAQSTQQASPPLALAQAGSLPPAPSPPEPIAAARPAPAVGTLAPPTAPPARMPPPLPPRAKRPEPVRLARASDAAPGEIRFDELGDRKSIEIVFEEPEELVDVIEMVDSRTPSVVPPPPPPIDRVAKMAGTRLFAGLSKHALVALASAAELAEFAPGANVFRRNDAADALYAIVEGTAKVTVRGSPDIRLGEGDVFGEACLLEEAQRQADVDAESPLMALRIRKKALDEVTSHHAEVENALFELLARRLVMNLMHTSPLFASFEPSARLELSQMFEVRRAELGTVLAERGLRSDGLYVLLAGDVRADTGTVSPIRIARGSAFGHASLLGGDPSDVTITAVTEAVLLRLPAARFASLAAFYPPALAHLSETAHVPLKPSLVPL